METLKNVFKLPNLVILITIILGTLSALGITDNFISSTKVITSLVTLIATQLLLDRLGILKSIYENVKEKRDEHSIQLKPRTDPSFMQFPQFADNAKEIYVAGIDLGFLAISASSFVQESLKKGVNFKLLLINPDIDGFFKDIINNHDERNEFNGRIAHEHISAATETLNLMRNLVDPSMPGTLEIRARVDIPNPTFAMIDPSEPQGKIRVELKPYKRNHGDVPYFILDRKSAWYATFYEHYYRKLWNDSIELYSSRIQ